MPAPSGATPILALPYPIPDDSVDVPRDIQALATKLDGMSSLRPPLVTALPGAPVDGQEIYYLADAANGITWHLRYRAASASTYKWETIGGGPLYAEDLNSGSVSGGTYADIATAPSLVLPLAGDYFIAFGSVIANAAAGGFSYAAPKLGAAAPNDNDSIFMVAAIAGHTIYIGARTIRRTINAAGATVRLQFKAPGGTGTYYFSHLAITPARVG